jgi:hypothetical protein
MRLLNSTTLDFQVFNDEQLPPYAILSHTWGDEEVSYQDHSFMQRLAVVPKELRENAAYTAVLESAAGLDFMTVDKIPINQRAGYRKIKQTAKIAKEMDLKWLWVDTCCIDKSSSAELQEAINAMYRWYQQSTFCLVYLEDCEAKLDGRPTEEDLEEMLMSSKWITRGWTLQELIAPRAVTFYDSAWQPITEKLKSLPTIHRVTRIPEYVLATGNTSQASVAQRMSWAAHRTTSRVEDIAYSLLGIFEVHMPMLYGERANAFLRLQEEIIRKTPDDSIFAWTSMNGSRSKYRGMLARSPKEFEKCINVSRGYGNFAISNMGLRIEMDTMRIKSDQGDESVYLGLLNARLHGQNQNTYISIEFQNLVDHNCVRISSDHIENWHKKRLQDFVKRTLYFEHLPRIPPPPHFKSRMVHSVHFRRAAVDYPVPAYKIQTMRPSELTTLSPPQMIVPHRPEQYQHDFRFPVLEDMFLACAKLTHVEHREDVVLPYPPMLLLIGYNKKLGHSWCQILEASAHPEIGAPIESWHDALHELKAHQTGSTRAFFNTGIPGINRTNIYLSLKIVEDELCLMVNIDGLIV